MNAQDESAAVTVDVENLGGIKSQQLRLQPGVSILTGRNATNRTSFLRSVGAVLGGSSGQLKSDADEGEVTLRFDGTQYTRTFERDGGSVQVSGDPYTDDNELVDQYGILLADNPAREAVERGDNEALRAFIMEPVDTAAINERIERMRQSIQSLRDELAAAKRMQEREPELQRRLEGLQTERDGVNEKLASIRDSVEEFEADDDDVASAEAVVTDLKDAREEYERVRSRLETQRDALDSLRAERDTVADELSELSAPDTDTAELETELQRLQRRERDLENTVNSLLSIVEFNEQLTGEGQLPAAGGDSIASDLNPESQSVECWTCGTTVERGEIDDKLEDLRGVIEEKRRERNNLRAQKDRRQAELTEVRELADHRQALQSEIADIEAEIASRTNRVADLETETEALRERIDELEAEAADSDDLRDSDLLEQYQRLSELEYERGQLEEQIASVEAELESVREQAARVEELEADLTTKKAELTSARTRIEELERSAIETFNEHMETVLALLGYENIERVWIERKVETDDDSSGVFDLHVVRTTDDDVVYEDTVQHLSESEREVIGLVVALAGYLVHDVHDVVPVMVLDSLEAIDADRIAALVEHFAEFVPYLVVALLPEDAAALPNRYDRIQMGQPPA